MRDICSIANKCKEYIDQNISFRRNKITCGQVIFTDYDVIGSVQHLESLLEELYKSIRSKYPDIAAGLKESMTLYDNDKIVHISAIKAIVECMCEVEKPVGGRRIFISHSSKDFKIVSDFVDRILCLGIGINRNDIFCTSIEDIAIRNGDDIRLHIHENILSADYSFLLISNNYKASEICLNEMGAVWANGTNVRLYLLPEISFNSIGWLCDTRKANKITDTVALDMLYKELQEYYSLPDNFANWSLQRELFINRSE